MVKEYRNNFEIYADMLDILENSFTLAEISRKTGVNHGKTIKSVSNLGSYGMLKIYDGEVLEVDRRYNDKDFVRYIRTKKGKDFLENFRNIQKMLKPTVYFTCSGKKE